MHAPARARQCLSKTEKLNQIPGVGLFGLEVRLGGGLEAPFDGRVGRGGEGVRLGLCLHWLPALFVEHVVLEEELRGGDIPRPSEALACNQRSSEALACNQRSSEIIRDHQRHLHAIRDHQRQLHAIRDHQRKAAQSKAVACRTCKKRQKYETYMARPKPLLTRLT